MASVSMPGQSIAWAGTELLFTLQKELKDIERDHGSGVTVRVLGDNVHKLHGTITGTSLDETMLGGTSSPCQC